MSKLVGAFGTPHGPMLPRDVAQAPGKLPAEALMAQVREQLEVVARGTVNQLLNETPRARIAGFLSQHALAVTGWGTR